MRPAAAAAALALLLPAAAEGGGSREGFSLPLPGLEAQQAEAFARGRGLFRRARLPGPRDDGRGGLGPVFNRNACSGCHERNGRGRPPPAPGAAMTSMVVRLAGHDPAYGAQLNDKAVVGVPAEGRARLVPGPEEAVAMEGGGASLRGLRVELRDMAFGPLTGGVAPSPRVAPQVAGTGLLEAVPEEAVLARADPGDRDGDGISGRARMVPGPDGGERVGRLGWRARHADVRGQVAEALSEDMGVTSPGLPRPNCAPAQRECLAAAGGAPPEVPAADVDALAAYVRLLAPPERRDAQDPEVRRGEEAFLRIGCAGCHVPEWPAVPSPVPGGGEGAVRAWTDLLLHDMGEGLADRPAGGGPGPREWRTAPLWGIGLVERVNGHTRFLHDGRARGLAEAVLWHGGEAEAAREAFRALGPSERRALLAFLGSL